MRTHTITLSVAASGEELFAWLADSANVSRWTSNFIRRIEKRDTGWRGVTALGQTYFTIKAHRETGVLDLLVGTELDQMTVFPMRVLSQPHGASVTLTIFQPAAIPSEIHEQIYFCLLADMRALMRRFGGGELSGAFEESGQFHPSIVTGKFYETWDFYTAILGFTTLAECGHYVQLKHPSGAQLGVLREEMDGAPVELISATTGRGFWLNLDVSDADAEYARLRSLGVTIDEPPQDRSWGERSFEVRDPNGIVIFVGHRIARPVEDEAMASHG